jgi:predicted aspartyl protease
MRASTCLLLIACLTPLGVHAGASGNFERGERGHVLVPVSVNGAEAKAFAVDTAASQTVLDLKNFGSLAAGEAESAPQAPVAHGAPDAGGAQGAHGTFVARGVSVDSLSLCQAEQRGQVAVLMTLSDLTHGEEPDFVGVLGLPFLRKYVLDIDYPARRLALHERPGSATGCDICSTDSAIPVASLLGGLPSVPVTVNGVAMRAVLDTGASRTVLNDKALAALGLAGAGTGEAVSRASLALGQGAPRPHDVSYLDLPVFGALGLADEPALILGIDYLSAGRVVLDIGSGRAWFRPALE